MREKKRRKVHLEGKGESDCEHKKGETERESHKTFCCLLFVVVVVGVGVVFSFLFRGVFSFFFVF